MFYETSGPSGLPHDPFKALAVPRPIGWISSLNADGGVNLAPYSFFNAIATNPPMVVFGPGGQHSHGGLKDTIANIEKTGEFVCNLVTWDNREAMNRTSAPAPHGIDEFALAGLTPQPSKLVAPPRVAESPAHLECRHWKTVELPCQDSQSPNHAIFGEVIGVHIDDRFIVDGRVDLATLRPVARLGYLDYAVVDTIFSMARPGYP